MFISVVIPAYNEEKYLSACLQALCHQTYPREQFEVIVVDNGSTDATAQIAQEFGARVVEEPIKGIARARQRGFEAARGEVIASTDADTVVPPFWLARIAGHFNGNPELGGVYGPVYWYDGRLHERLIMQYPVTWALMLSNRMGRTLWVGSNFAVRAEVFWQVRGFEDYDGQTLMGEDIYLSLRLSRVTRIVFDPDLVVFASARRTQEGYLNFLGRVAASTARVVFLRQPPVPMPDIR
jgi:glycosyltransferase involved in cell wall biosynthesis